MLYTWIMSIILLIKNNQKKDNVYEGNYITLCLPHWILFVFHKNSVDYLRISKWTIILFADSDHFTFDFLIPMSPFSSSLLITLAGNSEQC